MLCEKCKVNQANVKYSQNINGVKVDYNLCDSCFNLLKINNSFIDNFFNSFFSSHTLNHTYEKNCICNVCGNTFERFKNSGEMGCSNCYDTFKDKLEPIFNDIQQKSIHIGKQPKNLEAYKPRTDSIKLLKEKLNIAINNENYEEAIKLRDKIKELERGDM